MAEKVTRMILHVELQCPSCYKEIKKILCKFPQIRDQVYDYQKNLVKISVVCCSPEEIKDKLCCEGGKVIKSIEKRRVTFKETDKAKPPPQDEKPKDTHKPAADPPPVTWMILHVELQCPSCYKKIKKILCKFPQIRDQVYDNQKNLVKISVVCCSPEKIKDKLCCEGGKVIKSIEIVGPKLPDDRKVTFKLPKEAAKPAPEKPKDAKKAKPPPQAGKPKDTPKPAADPPKKPDPAPATPKDRSRPR